MSPFDNACCLFQEGTQKRGNHRRRIYRYGNDRIKLSTGEKIKTKFWNAKDHRSRETKQFKEWENLNARLEDIETGVMNASRDHITKNAGVILDQLAEEFKPILKPTAIKTARKHTFLSAIKEYIATTNKHPRTIVSYNSTLSVLTDYQNTLKNELSVVITACPYITPSSLSALSITFFEDTNDSENHCFTFE